MNHKAFKTPLPEYEKEESPQVHKKNHDAKINYTYANIYNVINMLELIKSIYTMGPKYDKEPNYDMYDERLKAFLRMCNCPLNINNTRSRVSLRMAESSSSHSKTLNSITRGQSKVVLKVANDPKHASSSNKLT